MQSPAGQEIPGKPELPAPGCGPVASVLRRVRAWRPLLPCGRLTDGASTFLYWAIPVLFLWACNWSVTLKPAAKPLGVFALLCALILAYGRLFILVAPASFRERAGLSIQFLCGYLVLNSFLFALTVATPFGIAANSSIVALCGVATFFIRFKPDGNSKSRDPLPDLLCLLLCVAATALWCGDALKPFMKEGTHTVFRLWPDSFFHARQISVFAQAHGLRTISDMRMAGVPAPVYHYAGYALPAAVRALAGTGAYQVFASFQLPLGVFLSGLAAFALGSAIWGEWPGLAAAAAVLLMRDAYEQGFANKFLSYNFLQQVGTGGLYGVACVTVAWIFILLGCGSGELGTVLIGYAIALLTVFYKAHIFVANAFIVMIYPCFFFKKLAAKHRLSIGLVFVAAFISAAAFSQRLKSVPTLRLDGSAIHEYASLLARSYDRGILRSTFKPFTAPEEPRWICGIDLAAMILLSSLGLWVVACPLAAYFARKKTDAAALFLPLFVGVNYLVMSVGLAMDEKGIAGREELLHRPFVWAYFVLAAWTGGAAYVSVNGNCPPATRSERLLTCALVLAGLTVPATFGRNLQTLPAWRGWTFKQMNSIPGPLEKACLYIRRAAGPTDIIQDSENDGRLIISSLSERQDFVSCPAETGTNTVSKIPEELTRRVNALTAFKAMRDETAIEEFARKNNISWYVLEPASKIAWPLSLLNKPAFQSAKYRVYHFNRDDVPSHP
jgi:hypothetical protein